MTEDAPAVGSSAASRLAQQYVDGAVASAYGQETLDVPTQRWVEVLTTARDDLGLTYFDWLTAVDQLDDTAAPGFDVVVHLWSVDRREHLFVRTRVSAPHGAHGAARLPTLTGVFAGASWHERETFEMFGISATAAFNRLIASSASTPFAS